MSDKTWKPKRVTDGPSDSTREIYTVELSIQGAETKKSLEEIVAAKDGFQLKDSKDTAAPSLYILELDANYEETFSFIRDLTKTAPSTEIFLAASTLDSQLLLEGMRAGAKEFLAKPIQKREVEDALTRFQERAIAGIGKSGGSIKSAKILAFFGGKGGVGTTSVAVNTASALMRLSWNPKVVLVDVNQHGGDLPLYLDLQPSHSFRDISADPSRLDQAFLNRVLTKYESGLQVLASGYDDLSAGRLSPDCVEGTLKILKENFDYVVMDCGHVLDLTTKKALEMATMILVTSTLMVPVVHRTKRILELLRGSGFAQNKLRLIMNRFLSSEKEVLTETEAILKQKADWMFPNDYPSVSYSVNSGKPLIETVPKSAVGKSYMEFAYTFDEQPKKSSGKTSVLGWLRPFKSGKTPATT
ncbi:MAG: AAA family ATPase [Nitrospirota bacterium]|nr:AAA family ATPase [Nitrospirota bacterium]